jgi:hypothetical protein
VCSYTGVLAAGDHQEKGRPISTNTKRRREVGRNGKTGFYDAILEQALEAAQDWQGNDLVENAVIAIRDAQGRVTGFANDFQGIVASPPDHLSLSLKHSICVLNMDGNSFGAKRVGVKNIDEYRRFSQYLDILKAGILARILLWIADENNAMLLNDVARFETLMWGGDEFTFVLPAWKGWELATLIHDAVKDWKSPGGDEMTFATGLVFGPYKSPIRDLKNAASSLVDAAKSGKPSARWQALAFESVDRVHFSPKGFRRDWLGVGIDDKHFNFSVEDAVTLPDLIEKSMLPTLSRTRLHRLYYRFKDRLGEKDADTSEIKGLIAHTAPEMPERELADVQERLFGSGEYPLLHFAQLNLLLEYIQPEAGRE